jgi:glycosyltransferase involved in cell wall biosynthesis
MEYDMIFIRHLVFTTPLRRFLRQISQYNTKIVCEFPTVPYEHEWTGVMGKILMAIDRRNKQKCLDKIDLVVHYGGFEMQGINNIEISNGIDLDSIQTNEGITKEKSDQVRFVAIGRWAYWHGLDRFIRGMVLIDSEVHLDIVGTGPELMNLNRLVSKLSLSNRITFHEAAFDDRLSELLMNADIGIGTLGLHRKKVARDSSLKHRLYAAYGLPFILSSEDRDFNETESHCFHVEADDDPIDLERIIQQFQSLQRTNSNYRNHIQEWAKEHLTWEKRIKKILETLETI